MMLTNRIVSGFDAELQLGSGWFLTAFRSLNEKGLLLPNGPPPPFPPDAGVTVDAVQIIFPSDNRDLQLNMTVGGVPITILLTLEVSDDGTELVITSSAPNSEPTRLPFGVLAGLAGPPVLMKLPGDADHAPVIAFLTNLDLRASPQSGEPLPPGEHLERGVPLAFSFLPNGKDIAFGIGANTFPRLANDMWHSQLRANDGSHPFPDVDDRQGVWKSVEVSAETGRIGITLKAEVPIDLFPDADITIKIDLMPDIINGNVKFNLKIDTDVDTGLLGDFFAFLGGGVLGFIIGVIFGGPLIGAGIGAFAGVIALEVGEAVKNGEVKRRVVASVEGEEIQPTLICQENLVVEATPHEDGGNLVELFINAVPQSISIGSDQPEAIFERTLLVKSIYDDFQMDTSGMAFAGIAEAKEYFEPLPATLTGTLRAGEELQALIYEAIDGTEVEISLAEVFDRMQEGELVAPYKVGSLAENVDTRRPEGRLPSMCLSAEAIRRKDTVVKEIQFSTGLVLTVPETVALQDAGAVIVKKFQLIHPNNANPYFRATADGSVDNNFESLPRF